MESSRSKLLLSQENHLYEECSVCGVYCVLGGMEGYVMAPLHSGNQGQINGGRESTRRHIKPRDTKWLMGCEGEEESVVAMTTCT